MLKRNYRYQVYFIIFINLSGVLCGQELQNQDGNPEAKIPANMIIEEPMNIPENHWTRISDVPSDPLGRELEPGRGAYLCYEPSSKAFLRYGGYTPTDCNALWIFHLKRRLWKNPLPVDYSWPPPTNRPAAGLWWSMAYDSNRKVIWFFGGWGLAGRTHPELMHDIWCYDPKKGSFTAMASTGLPDGGLPGVGCRIVYDPTNDLIIRAPATAKLQSKKHEIWVYNPKTNIWEARLTTGGPNCQSDTPPGRSPVFVFHEKAAKAIFLDPQKDGSTHTWTYDAKINLWTKLDFKISPPGRVCAGVIYDPIQHKVIIHGGIGINSKMNRYLYRATGIQLSDTWELDLSKPAWTQLNVGSPVIPILPGHRGDRFPRFEFMTAMGYDTENQTIILAAPTMGVWALRYRPEGAIPLPKLQVDALPKTSKPISPERVYNLPPLNPRLVNIQPNTWLELGGGEYIGGSEVHFTYDEATGFMISYGGCGSEGTAFAGGYSNALSAYDPATERWLALRWYDLGGPPRHTHGCNLFLSYDPIRKATWFSGGTFGNPIATSILPQWTEKEYIWNYDGLKDRFQMVAVTKERAKGNGVLSCYDRINDIFLIVSEEANAWGYDPKQSQWQEIGTSNQTKERGKGYQYPCYVDSLNGMFFLDRDTRKPILLSTHKNWVDLPSNDGPPLKHADKPSRTRRSSSAYDPQNNIVLSILDDNAWVYEVATGKWNNLGEHPKKAVYGENLVVFDRRHGVFLMRQGIHAPSRIWAYKYAK